MDPPPPSPPPDGSPQPRSRAQLSPASRLRSLSLNVRSRKSSEGGSTTRLSPRARGETLTVSEGARSQPWDPDSPQCHICGVFFTVFTRRHHCRMCGKNCCSGCSPARMTIVGYRTPERVCRTCEATSPPAKAAEYSDGVVLKKGLLQRVGDKNTRKVSVVLTTEMLVIDGTDTELLTEIESAVPATPTEDRSCCFELSRNTKTQDRPVPTFQCRSEEERATWILAINGARNPFAPHPYVDVFRFVPSGSGVVSIPGREELWRVFPNGTVARGVQRWSWNGCTLDASVSSWNGVAMVVEPEEREDDQTHAVVEERASALAILWFPLVHTWGSLARFQGGKLLSLQSDSVLACMEGTVCAPLVLSCYLLSVRGV